MEQMVSVRRLYLALAWGKWLAVNKDQAEQSLVRCKEIRKAMGLGGHDGNYGILVHEDEWAMQYQRVDFRIKRAERAVGGYGVMSIQRYGEETISWRKGSPEILNHNFEQFQKYQRAKAHSAIQAVEDWRHPMIAIDEKWDDLNPPEPEWPGW